MPSSVKQIYAIAAGVSLLALLGFVFAPHIFAAWIDAPNNPPTYGATGCSPAPCLEADFTPVTQTAVPQSKAGSLAIGTSVAPAYPLDVAGDVNITGTYRINGISLTSGGGSVLSGAGTANYLSKWTNTNVLGNSLIFDNGTNVGIGIASGFSTLASNKLEVSGAVLGQAFFDQNNTAYFLDPASSGSGNLAGSITLGGTVTSAGISTGTLRVTGGTLALGNVLTSDAAGNATWGTIIVDGVPAGSVVYFNLATCPSGWVAADGTGGTPDLRGEFIRGLDSGRGVDVGRTLGSWQVDMFKSHTHLTQASANGSGTGGTGPFVEGSYNRLTSATGEIETRPRNVALLGCIKVAVTGGGGGGSSGTNYWTLSGTDIYNNNTGNVGIGTTNPTGMLQIGTLSSGVNGSINGAGNPTRLIVNGANGSEAALTLGHYSAGYGLDLWVPANPSAPWPTYIDNINRYSGFRFRNNTSATPVELMTIDETGKVGIGTTAPASALHLSGDRYATFGPNSTWGANLQVGGNGRVTTNASVAATNGNLHLDSQDGGYGTYINYYSNGPTLIGALGGAVGIGNGAGGGYPLRICSKNGSFCSHFSVYSTFVSQSAGYYTWSCGNPGGLPCISGLPYNTACPASGEAERTLYQFYNSSIWDGNQGSTRYNTYNCNYSAKMQLVTE